MTKSNRVNVYLTDDMRNSIKEQAEKMGLSQSSFIVFAVNEYIKQSKAAEFATSLPSVLQKLESLKVDAQ